MSKFFGVLPPTIQNIYLSLIWIMRNEQVFETCELKPLKALTQSTALPQAAQSAKMSLLYQLLCLCSALLVCYGAEESCPTTDIKPCTCRTYVDGSCIITCSMASQTEVNRLADIPNLCNGQVHFTLVYSKARGIPAKLWKTLLSSKTVDITLKEVNLKSLVLPGTGDIPEVSTPGTAAIKVVDAYVENWDWKQLSNFKSEELTIAVEDTPVEELDETFSGISNGQVHKITLDSTLLKKVRDDQFASFEELSSLSLQNNHLTTIPRSMLPKPAKKLEFLHLNGNKLSSIPVDMFSDMPALKVVYLRDNNLKSLPQELFKSVSSTLKRVDLVNNPWECNCDMVNFLKNTQTFLNMGLCASPPELAGKKVRDLPTLIKC